MQYVDELREHDNGDMAGKPLAEVPFPRGLEPHEKFGSYGESAIEFRARGEHVFSWIKKQSTSYNRIAIVAHGGMISRILESFLSVPMMFDIYFQTADTGIHLLEYTEYGRVVRFTNSATHLEDR